jgi:hypothetical protein
MVKAIDVGALRIGLRDRQLDYWFYDLPFARKFPILPDALLRSK